MLPNHRTGGELTNSSGDYSVAIIGELFYSLNFMFIGTSANMYSAFSSKREDDDG